MTDDPFLALIVEALNLMHPRFAGTTARSFGREFYHQFRHLWDKALPLRLGLGHVIVQDEPDAEVAPLPDLLIWQLGERGESDRRLGAVSLALLSDSAVIAAELDRLRHFREHLGYPHAVCVIVGRAAEVPEGGLLSAPGVTVVFFDTDRWSAAVVG